MEEKIREVAPEKVYLDRSPNIRVSTKATNNISSMKTETQKETNSPNLVENRSKRYSSRDIAEPAMDANLTRQRIMNLEAAIEIRSNEVATLESELRHAKLQNEKMHLQEMESKKKIREYEAVVSKQQSDLESKLVESAKLMQGMQDALKQKDSQIEAMAEKVTKKRLKVKAAKSAHKLTISELKAANDQIALLKTQIVEANRKQLEGLEELQAGCSEAGIMKARV